MRAFARARARVPAARLSIAGAGPAEPTLRALIGELGLGDSAVLHGQLGGDALESTLARGWVHAVPSRWPEPFGITTTEAMMRGTAVVASDIGGLAESVVHESTGLLVPPGDELMLADALVRLLSDRALAERFGAAGRARAHAHFTLDGSITRFERLYDSLRSPKPLPHAS